MYIHHGSCINAFRLKSLLSGFSFFFFLKFERDLFKNRMTKKSALVFRFGIVGFSNSHWKVKTPPLRPRGTTRRSPQAHGKKDTMCKPEVDGDPPPPRRQPTGLQTSRKSPPRFTTEEWMQKPSGESPAVRTFLVVQWLRLWAPNAGGTGSITVWGTNILHATQYGQQNPPCCPFFFLPLKTHLYPVRQDSHLVFWFLSCLCNCPQTRCEVGFSSREL